MPILLSTRDTEASMLSRQLCYGKRIVPIAVPIPLEPDEYCFFAKECEWNQLLGEPPARTLRPAGSGILYITNQRLMFMGDRQSRMGAPHELDDAIDHDNGAEVRWTNGETDFFTLPREDAVLASFLIDTLINNGFEQADVVAFVIKEFKGSKHSEGGQEDIL